MKTLVSTTLALVAALVALPARAQEDKASIALPALTMTFTPVYVAQDLGIWKGEGLDVTLHDIIGLGSTNAMLAGSVALYLPGLVWLANFVGASEVLGAGLLPFIPGDVVKIVLAALALPFGWKLLAKR